MRILGIDQSYTSCGLVLLNEEGTILNSDLFKADKSKDRIAQAHQISTMIGSFCLLHEPTHIYIEGLAFGMMGNVTRDLAGLQFVIINHLRYRHGYDEKVEIIPPTTLKKFATGKGNSKKEILYEMLPENVKTYIDDLGVKKTTGRYDMTDAYYLAKYGVEQCQSTAFSANTAK